MNNIQPNQFSQLLWSKEASALLMAALQWDTNELETRLKSPYPLIFPLLIQPNDCNKSVYLPNRQPIDEVANDAEPVNKEFITPRNLEDCKPGASRTLVLEALKKVSKSPKPSQKHSGQPVSTSK